MNTKPEPNPYLPRIDTDRLLNLLDVGHNAPAPTIVTEPTRMGGAGDFRFPDADRDGVPDLFDCDPLDPAADGWLGDAYRRAQAFFRVDYAAAARRRASVRRAVSRGGRAAARYVRRAPPSPTRYISRRISREVSRRAAPAIRRIVSRPTPAQIKRVTAAAIPKITAAVELKKAISTMRPPSRAGLMRTGIAAVPGGIAAVAAVRGVVAAKPAVEQVTGAIGRDLAVDYERAAQRRADVVKARWGAPKQVLTSISEMGEPFRERMESRVAATTARQQAKFPEGTISPGSRWFAEQTARVAHVARGFEQPVEQRMQAAEEFLGLHSERIPESLRWVGGQAKELGYSIAFDAPSGAVELVGMAPVAGEAMWKRKDIIPAAVGVGLVTMGKGIYHRATTSPTRLFGELYAFGAYAKGIGELPKASPYYLGGTKGVKPYTGRPSWWGRIVKGEKPHPTPEAKMVELYDPKLYETPQKFFHGTSMQFIKATRAAGETRVHPEAAALRGARGVESSLFLSKPGRPYTKFATPETVVRIGKGASVIEVRTSTLEQLMTGRLTRQQVAEQLSKSGRYTRQQIQAVKDVKASGDLRSLISKRGSLQRKLAELEKAKLSDISPKRMKTEAELYDLMRKVEKRTASEYGKATGERVRLHDEPGAFLMIETTPRKPSATLIKKAIRREALRTLEKEGKITPKQTKELRRFERELKEEVTREYFEAPRGEVMPSPKPAYGYEWKGITESEFTMRAGTELYPITTGRSRFYGRLGITKGTHFTQDPYTGRWLEIQEVTTAKLPPTAKPPTIIDVPELFRPFRKIAKHIPKRKLTTKEKSEIIRIDREIKKATTDYDFRRIEELQGRRRVIQYGERGMDLYQRPALPETRPPTRIARPVERVTRPVDRVDRGIRPTDRVIRETRPPDREFREARPTDRVERVTRPTERVFRDERVTATRITTTTPTKDRLTTIDTHIREDKDKDKRRRKVRGEREEYEWAIENPLLTLEEFFGDPPKYTPTKPANMIPTIPAGVV